MSTPIIATKLHLPSPPRVLVHRERLNRQLDAGISGKLILLSAPAGFGKTSLLADWASSGLGDHHISWLHLDENDNQLARFLRYLAAALQTLRADLGEAALSGLQSIPPAPSEVLLATLINDLDAFPGRLVLVLDDYHQVDTREIHEAVSFLIENLPENACLVVATRVDPPLPIHLLRSRGQLTEIRAEQLRFNNEEIRILLEDQLGISLSPGDIAVLEKRVEGWAAGLQMAALSLQGQQDRHQFIKTFSGSHRFIMDYLSEEIFNQQPAQIQKFLLQTSILNRLSGPLCDYVLGEKETGQDGQNEFTSSQQVLEHLEHANLFLLPMDDDRHWYRYHRLFESLLRQRLRTAMPQEIPVSLQRASTWCEANGYYEEALLYALAAGDIKAAAQLVEKHAMGFLKTGDLDTLSNWLGRLPDEVIHERPWLSVYMSWVLLLKGNFEQIKLYLSAAEEKASGVPDTEDLHGHITAVRAYASAMAGEAEQAYALANQALDLLPPGDLAVRSVVGFVLGGINVLRGDIAGAVEAMQQAGEIGERAGNIHLAVSALSSAGDLLRRQGRPGASERSYMRALEMSKGHSGQPLPIAASAYAGLAELYLDRRDMENARSSVESALELSVKWGNAENRVGCQLALARVLYQEGDTVGAHEALNEAKHLDGAHQLSPDTGERIAAYEAYILQGREDRVNQGLLVEPLSDRELEVLRLMAKGRSNLEIAAELIIALGTVKAHSSSIYRKLDVGSRTEAVVKASELGLL